MLLPLLALTLIAAARPPAPAPEAHPVWLGTELPLQLRVTSPEELRLKSEAEREYLIFNLLASGKLAWDAGDFAAAATRWEALLRVPGLSAELVSTVQPFATQARQRAGGQPPTPMAIAPSPAPAPKVSEPELSTVSGRVTGGGALGPGGAVVWLERADGATPRPHPATDRTMVQRNKMFVPRVLVVPQGTRVSFRNDDPLFHDVFSLSKPTAFDLGLYKGGDARERVFETPGPVQLLCNIHATMQGFIFVVKSPWYAQADATGSYRIRAVPPGDYVAHVWHEAAAKVSEQRLHVEGASTNLALVVGGDASRPAFVPDKYGKPRQIQLGY